MKNNIIGAILLTMFVSCSQNDESTNPNKPTNQQTEFFASAPSTGDSRTYVEDNKYLRWNAGDEITIFNGNSYNSHWQFAGLDGANSGRFTEISESGFVTGTPLDLTAHYAIYPYDENITITEADIVSLTLPAIQPYNHSYTNSFGRGANTMMAVTKNTSDNFLAFRNLCGYLKLKLYGDNITVKNITVKGNNGEKIAGNATVSMVYGSAPTVTMGADATETITIDCGEGVTLSNDSENPTIFWVAIPEITFEDGITITIIGPNGQTFFKQTTNKVPIRNNYIQPMATLNTIPLKIGDIIVYNKQEGIIYSMEDSTIKLVSIDFTKTSWCKPAYVNVITGAKDYNDGRINVQQVKSEDYFSHLPAFVWCNNFGNNWYLPAANELHKIYNAKFEIDSTLSANGYQTLDNGFSHFYYWSSTEDRTNTDAYSRDFGNGYSHTSPKLSEFYVRAVASIEI